MTLQRLQIIELDWNEWNVFSFEILRIEYSTKTTGFDGALFGIYFSKEHLDISLFFLYIEIKKPF